MQIALEDIILSNAAISLEQNTLILCDWGLLDGKAYSSTEVWQACLDELGVNEVHLREKRYDAVIHMVTAADGAEKYYQLENEAWYEDQSIAWKTDIALQNAWIGHPHLHVIGNNTESFDSKINQVLTRVLKILGLPTINVFMKKFLLKGGTENGYPLPADLKHQKFTVIERYLTDEPNKQTKISKRGQENFYNYSMETRRYDAEKKKWITLKQNISARDYIKTSESRLDNQRPEIEKVR